MTETAFRACRYLKSFSKETMDRLEEIVLKMPPREFIQKRKDMMFSFQLSEGLKSLKNLVRIRYYEYMLAAIASLLLIVLFPTMVFVVPFFLVISILFNWWKNPNGKISDPISEENGWFPLFFRSVTFTVFFLLGISALASIPEGKFLIVDFSSSISILHNVENEFPFRLKRAGDNKEKIQFISQFKAEFESKKDVYQILFVAVSNNAAKQWVIAGYNDNEEFKTVLIDNPNDELAIELEKATKGKEKTKEKASISKVFTLVKLKLGRTIPIREASRVREALRIIDSILLLTLFVFTSRTLYLLSFSPIFAKRFILGNRALYDELTNNFGKLRGLIRFAAMYVIYIGSIGLFMLLVVLGSKTREPTHVSEQTYILVMSISGLLIVIFIMIGARYGWRKWRAAKRRRQHDQQTLASFRSRRKCVRTRADIAEALEAFQMEKHRLEFIDWLEGEVDSCESLNKTLASIDDHWPNHVPPYGGSSAYWERRESSMRLAKLDEHWMQLDR